MRTKEISFQAAGTATSDATTTSVAKEAGNASSAGDNRARSDRGSGENRGGNDMFATKNKRGSMKPICYRCEQEGRKKLL